MSDHTAKRRNFHEKDKVLLLLTTDPNKLLMQRKGPYSVISRFGERNRHCVQGNKKMKNYYANILKQYIEKRNDDKTPKLNIEDQHITLRDICTRGRFSVDDHKLMELINHKRKEKTRNVKLGIGLTTLQ